MFIITVKGEASTCYPNLKELDGIDCQDNFAEYFDKTSYSNDIKSGYMNFKYENGKLFTVTTYNSKRELNQDELNDLLEYTTGQWSDGIGEGFEQRPCMEVDEPYDDGDEYSTDVYISPWSFTQIQTITQKEK